MAKFPLVLNKKLLKSRSHRYTYYITCHVKCINNSGMSNTLGSGDVAVL